MARRRKGGRRYGRKWRSRARRKKLFMGFGMLDMALAGANAQWLGWIDAAELAMSGKIKEAGQRLAYPLGQPKEWLNIIANNAVGGLGIRMIRKFVSGPLKRIL